MVSTYNIQAYAHRAYVLMCMYIQDIPLPIEYAYIQVYAHTAYLLSSVYIYIYTGYSSTLCSVHIYMHIHT